MTVVIVHILVLYIHDGCFSLHHATEKKKKIYIYIYIYIYLFLVALYGNLRNFALFLCSTLISIGMVQTLHMHYKNIN